MSAINLCGQECVRFLRRTYTPRQKWLVPFPPDGENSTSTSRFFLSPQSLATLRGPQMPCALPGAVASCGRDGGCRPQTPDPFPEKRRLTP